MADDAILTVTDATVPVTGQVDSLVLYARGIVPMFWLALFRLDNLHSVQWERDRIAEPFLLQARTECLTNLKSREACLFQALPESQRFVLREFHALLDNAPGTHIHCDPRFVSECALGRPFDRWLTDCLLAFEGPPPQRRRTGFSAFFLGSGLSAGWQNMLGRRPTAFEPWQLAGTTVERLFSWERDSA